MLTRRLRSKTRTLGLALAGLVLAPFGTASLDAAECYLMLYLGSNEQNVSGASKSLEGLERGTLPALDAEAPAYFVLVEDITMALVEGAAKEEGQADGVASSDSSSSVARRSEMAARAEVDSSDSGSTAGAGGPSESAEPKFRTFVPNDELGLGYFCADGTDEGESWYAPGGRIHATTRGDDLILGLTKKGASLPQRP